MVLKPEKEKEAEAIFRKWGLDFAVVGKTTPTKRFIVQARRRGDGRPADQGARRRGAGLRPAACRDAEAAGGASGRRDAADATPPTRSIKLIGSPDLCSQALGVGAVRPRHPRQHGAAAGRRRRGGARQRRAEGAGAHHRRDAALLRGRSVRRRQAGGGGSLAQPHRGRRAGRSRSPTISISAIRSGRRSWASSSAASAASARPAGRSTSRSCPATSRSTTRPTAARSCRRRRSAASACSTISTKSATLAFKADERGDPADRRDQGLARPVALSARDLRARGGRAAAGRSRGRAPQRRFRARADRGGRRHRRARRVRRRAPGRARRDGDGVRHRRRARRAAPIAAHAFWFGEDQARYVVTADCRQGGADHRTRARAAGVPVARARDHRRRRIDARGRAPHSGGKAARSVRGLAAGLYGGRSIIDRLHARTSPRPDADFAGTSRHPAGFNRGSSSASAPARLLAMAQSTARTRRDYARPDRLLPLGPRMRAMLDGRPGTPRAPCAKRAGEPCDGPSRSPSRPSRWTSPRLVSSAMSASSEAPAPVSSARWCRRSPPSITHAGAARWSGGKAQRLSFAAAEAIVTGHGEGGKPYRTPDQGHLPDAR